MNQEIHLFILWEKARDLQEGILLDITSKFDILALREIQWPLEHFSDNLSRFYRSHLPAGCEKEKHCGTDAFLVVLVRDNAPRYDVRHTTAGDEKVNKNMFDAKSLYRQWTGGGHRIHGSNSIEESRKDIFLLLGLTLDDLSELQKIENPVAFARGLSPEVRGLYAQDGFVSLTEFFAALNATTNYVVMRNYEYLPAHYISTEHGDIDLLCDSLNDLVYFAGATATHPKDNTRFQYTVHIGQEDVLFDFRCVGDGYYCEEWEKDILARRTQAAICIPNEQDYLFMLIYHAFIHKKFVSKEYLEKISVLCEKLFPKQLKAANDEVGMLTLLDGYLKKNNYSFTEPLDQSVVYNIYNTTRVTPKATGFHLALEKRPREAVADEIYDLLSEGQDALQQALLTSDSWALHYYLDPARANILRWYQFKSGAKVLELDAGMGALTQSLVSRCAELTAVCFDPDEASILSERLCNEKNLKVALTAPGQLKLEESYDYIIAVGLLEYAPAFSNAEDPYLDLLCRLKSALTKTGVLLLGAKNRFSAPSWCGAADDISGQPFEMLQNSRVQEWKCFTRGGLKKIVDQAGFQANHFYYLYPNEIFPTGIYDDEHLPELDEITGQYPQGSSIVLHQSNLYAALQEENLLPSFAGAFLVEASAQKLSDQSAELPLHMPGSAWLTNSDSKEENFAEWQKNAMQQAYTKEKAALEQDIRNKVGWIEQLLQSERTLQAELARVSEKFPERMSAAQLECELAALQQENQLLRERIGRVAASKDANVSVESQIIENALQQEEALIPDIMQQLEDTKKEWHLQEITSAYYTIWKGIRAGKTIAEILAQSNDPAVYYELTPEQETLLSALPLRSGMKVLQLSGRCGCLTRALAAKVQSVEVQEVDSWACRILRWFCRDCDNVQLRQATVQDMRTAAPYDIILLFGTLSQAAIMFPDSKNPEKEMLLWAFEKVRPGGAIYIAVDNTLGAQRLGSWSENNAHEKTFTRRELLQLLPPQSTARWFYPLPDYHSPVEIVEESYLSQTHLKNTQSYIATPTVVIHRENALLFELQNIEDKADHLNSFLLEVTKGEAK